MTQARFYSSATGQTTTTADPGAAGTSLAVASSAVFAALDGNFPWTLLINWTKPDQEIVNVTGRPDGTHLTIQRGQDGTLAQSHAVGATVEHGVSARDFTEAGAHVGAGAGVHGVTGQLVGTTDVQTLTNKTLTAPTVTTSLTAAGVNVLGAWTPYTPAWMASTTNPTIGNGTLTGAYMQVGKTVTFRAYLQVGSTSTIGSGLYWLTLPVAPKSGTSTSFSGWINDSSAGARWACSMSVSGATMRIFPGAAATSGASNTVPMAWAAGDELTVSGTYEVD